MPEQIMTHDKEASQKFHQILEQHKGILLKVSRTYCRNVEDREDLIQEIMIQIWKSLHKYDGSSSITTWLYRISLNVAISYYRKSSRLISSDFTNTIEIVQFENVSGDDKQEKLDQLERFISELNEFDKALILLYLEDKSYAEMAEIMGLSLTNVGTKLNRIKEKLKQKFSTDKS